MSDDFDQLTDRIERVSPLMGAFNAEEQLWYQGTMRGDHPDGFTSNDVVEAAWNRLSPDERQAEMATLFNAFFHHTQTVRKWLELQDKAPEGNTYLHAGDLEIIDDTMSGAMLLGGDQSLDELMPGGMVPIPIEVLQRLISEVELLQHRLAMKAEESK